MRRLAVKSTVVQLLKKNLENNKSRSMNMKNVYKSRQVTENTFAPNYLTIDVSTSLSKRVINVIREQLGLDVNQNINPSDKFIDDLGADSLDVVELVMAFEDAFGISIPDEYANRITTVGIAIQYLLDSGVKV